ncbi:hypothetical protein [Chryseobacterium sp. CT-SW4]|uniref:hypothetical protein n=1 Tax=Chryseobacterium sp. SW-1 TaxID=3157343 RepID=UPI003B02BC61
MLGIILFIVFPFYILLNKRIAPKMSTIKKLGISFLFFIFVIFLCGYKIPWFDKYPEIKRLPDHTNKKEIKIEVVKNLEDFNQEDSLKYFLPRNLLDCGGCSINNINFSENLKNISLYKQRVIDNHFVFNNSFVSGLRGVGNSGGSGGSGGSDNWDFHFRQRTMGYNKLKIANKETIFKAISINQKYYYQINYPKSEKDTLYFIEFRTLYRAYIINNK